MVGVEGWKVKIGACRNGDNWCAVLLVLEGCYSYQARLLDGVAEVNRPAAIQPRITIVTRSLDYQYCWETPAPMAGISCRRSRRTKMSIKRIWRPH
jgi:hypothetical protein